MLTQTAKYAIRALIQITNDDTIGYSQTRELARATGIPANYLGKILQKLTHARILDSQKGLHGGFRGARSAQNISLYDILVAIEAIPRDFVAQTAGSDDAGMPSCIYGKMVEMSNIYAAFLKTTSLAELAAKPATPARNKATKAGKTLFT